MSGNLASSYNSHCWSNFLRDILTDANKERSSYKWSVSGSSPETNGWMGGTFTSVGTVKMYHLNNYMYIQLQNWYIYIWQKITIICLSLFLYTVFMNIIMADTTKLLGYFLLVGKANIVQLLSLVSGTIHVNYRHNSV